MKIEFALGKVRIGHWAKFLCAKFLDLHLSSGDTILLAK